MSDVRAASDTAAVWFSKNAVLTAQPSRVVVDQCPSCRHRLSHAVAAVDRHVEARTGQTLQAGAQESFNNVSPCAKNV